MDRLRRRNPSRRPHSASLKPPRPPRGPNFHPPPASRPLPETSSPDGRQRKKVRFANEAGSHQIGGGAVANIPEAAGSKLQVCDAKTAEFKFYKKLCEQSSHRSHSYKHSHLSMEPNVSKQKQDIGTELHNMTLPIKVSVQRNTMCCNDPPATPKNEEIPREQVNAQASHSEFEKDTPHLNSDDYVPRIHVLTPIAQTSFEKTGISRNSEEPVSGQVFSGKRSRLLKLAAKTASMGYSELLQRRSEFVHDFLQRLGANNILRKQRQGYLRHRKIECRQAPATSKDHVDRLLDYKRSESNPLTTLKAQGQKSPTDESFEFMASGCAYNQSLPSYIDWKSVSSHGGNQARECMALPWVCIKDISSSDQNRGIVHNQVSNLVLKDVEPCILGRPASGNELSLNVQSASYDQHVWSPMLSVPLAESFWDRLSFPYPIEEQHAVPHANASWQPDLFSSMQPCISGSVGLNKEGPEEAGWCDNSDAGFSTRFNQLLVKSAASRLLGSGNKVVDHNDFRYISNFHVDQNNSMMLSAKTSEPSLLCSSPEHPYKLCPMSVHDSVIGVSCLAGLNEKHSREGELSDNSDKLLQVLDQLPLLPIFPKDRSRVWDHHLRYISSCPMKDPRLKSLSSCSGHPCKQDYNNFDDSSTGFWSSIHRLQSHTSLGSMLDLMSNESSYSDSGHHGLMLVQSNLNNDILGPTDLSFFGGFSDMDNIREAPMLSSDGIPW